MRRCIFLFACFCFFSSCEQGHNKRLRIGVDPSFSPINFEALQPYVNGYVSDVLLEIARLTGLEFERMHANWDDLLEGLGEERYDVVISSMPPYNFNLAKYEFAQSFLDIGPVLVVPVNSHYSSLTDLSGELVGVISQDPVVLVISKNPDVIIRAYTNAAELLNAVVNGQIEAAVLDRLVALNFVRDIFAGQLKIVSAPLNSMGLHTVTLRPEGNTITEMFNRAIDQLKKNKKLETLQQKWRLS